MKEQFISWNPSKKSKVLINTVNDILDEYEKQGYVLTLRQLYYQLVSRDIIPNKVEEYNKLGNVVNNGRLAGLIDWEMIEDRLRKPQSNSHWNSPQQILDVAISSYYRDRWVDQGNYVEVWCEKDAVSNIIQPVCRKYDVTFMANRGYSSQSAMYDAFRRLEARADLEKNIYIVYFGDHDPSGIDMTNDIRNRLGTFLFKMVDSSFNNVDRAALNLDQVRKYNPPNNPAKITDSRYTAYVKKFGSSSWELDALEPRVLADITEKSILQFVDLKKFSEVRDLENSHKEQLLSLKKYL